MRKFFIMGLSLVVSLAMLTTSCHKDETNNNGNIENPGEGSYNNQEYPSTAQVIRKAVTDIDGNIYDAVQIGNQVWMAENLRTTKYADGTTIPFDTYSETEPSRYVPGSGDSNEENMANVTHYGYLYNWHAVMHGAGSSEANPSGVQGICPNGWHVPSDAEWTQLTDYMKTQPQYWASGNANLLAKALSATWGWDSSSITDSPGNDSSTNNATGFSALPAGFIGFDGFGGHASFWSATEDGDNDNDAFNRYLCYSATGVYKYSEYKHYGFSVRCVRD